MEDNYFSRERVILELDELWARKPALGAKAMCDSWVQYEKLIDMIFHSKLDQLDRNWASMEALDAVTRRGHFQQYLPRY